MGWEYSEKTKQIFMDAVHGKPGTHMGEVQDPDGVGEHGSIACGDALRFSFKVERHPTDPAQDVIVEARYLTFGCTSAIAASEALCELIERGGYTPINALKITNEHIVDYLEGLPTQKIHCSVMGAEALQAAVLDWAKKRGVDLEKLGLELPDGDEEEGRIVCNCLSVSEPYIRRKVKELQLRTIEDITNAIKAGGACQSCHHAPGGLQDILDDIWGQQTDSPVSATTSAAPRESEGLSPFQFMKKVESVIEEEIRPALRSDGGDIELVDIKDRLVYCRLKGACAGCPGASMTLKLMVERTLKDRVDEETRIIAV
jgi:NifU-like protein